MPNPNSRFRDPSYARDYVDNLYDKARRRAELVPERAARPGAQALVQERPDPRSRRPIPVVPLTPADKRAIENHLKHNPAASNRGVPRVPGMPSRPRNPLPALAPRRLPGPMQMLDVLDLLDDLARDPRGIVPNVPWAPFARLMCQAVPLVTAEYPAVTHRGSRSGHVNAGDCGLGLQAWDGAGSATIAATGTSTGNATWVYLACRPAGPGPCNATAGLLDRFRYTAVYHFTFPAGGLTFSNQPVSVRAPYQPLHAGPDPNILRWMPGTAPQPSAGEPPLGLRRDPLTSDPTSITPIAWTGGSGGTTHRTPTAGRTPPGPGVKERKTLSRSQKIGLGLAKALDAISEWSEVVDAVYSALPDEVTERWDCNRRAPFIDQAGQYGIGNADCKARAIAHNLHKVDVEQAVKNIIENALEDQLYGAIHKHLPRQTVSAMDGSFQALADALRELKAFAGL